tara:strand:+ start:914 stop:1126 length:213 start_codon:yes stop_codon:yes gene_type:complete
MMSVDGNNIVRVSDDKAAKLYHEGFRYVSKSLWKEKVRDVEQSTEKTPKGNIKSNKMSKAQKRHMRNSNK